MGGGGIKRRADDQAFGRQGQTHAFKHDHDTDDAVAVLLQQMFQKMQQGSYPWQAGR